MDTKNQSKLPGSDEIDLSKLFFHTVSMILRHKLLNVSMLILGIIAGTVFFFKQKPVYESEMILTSRMIDGENSGVILNLLNQLVEEKNYSQLSKMLNIPKDEISGIKSIKSEILIEKPKDLGSAAIKDFFIQVTVEITNIDKLQTFQNSLVGYLENNQFVKKHVERKKEDLRKKIAHIENEISQIKKLKKEIESGGFKKGAQGDYFMYGPADLYDVSSTFYSEKVDLESELAFANNFEVLQPFIPYNKPASPRLSISILLGAMAGIFVSFLIMMVMQAKLLFQRLQREHAAS